MSERSNVSIAEILGENYYIDKLTSSDYSPSVGDTVTITLLVKDVFGDPVTGQTRTVTCTGGSFVSMNGTSITASSSVEVTTGSGGTVTLGLSVSVADNIVVSDGRVECVVSSLSDSITNHTTTFTDMIEKHTWSIPTFSLESGKGVEKTVTVPNPSGYYRVPIIQGAYRCSASNLGLSGNTLTVKIQNHYSTKANASMYGVILYFKLSIFTEI